MSKYSLLQYLKNPKSWTELVRLEGNDLRFFINSVAHHKKNWRGTLWLISFKKSLLKKRGTRWDFSTSILSQNFKKIERDPLGKLVFRKKVTIPKKLKGGPFVSPDIGCYAVKKGKPFWFSSLGEQLQFGALKFCKSFGRAILVTSGVSKKNTDEKPWL